jgi:hypothetical protein
MTVANAIAKCLPGANKRIDPSGDDNPAAFITTDNARFYLTPHKDDYTLDLSVDKR